MNRRTEFWERVNAALDERRDLLSDLVVQRLVAEDPSLLAELSVLEHAVADLRATPRARPLGMTLAAGVLALLGGVALLTRPGAPTDAVASTPASNPTRVVACRLTIVRTDAHGIETLIVEGERRSRTYRDRSGVQSESSMLTATEKTDWNQP